MAPFHKSAKLLLECLLKLTELSEWKVGHKGRFLLYWGTIENGSLKVDNGKCIDEHLFMIFLGNLMKMALGNFLKTLSGTSSKIAYFTWWIVSKMEGFNCLTRKILIPKATQVNIRIGRFSKQSMIFCHFGRSSWCLV